MKTILLCALLLGACTFNFTDDTPAFPLVGSPLALDTHQKLNAATSGRASLSTDATHVPWASMCEFWSSGSGNNGRNCKVMHLVRLGAASDAPFEQTLMADSFSFHGPMVYEMKNDMTAMTTAVTLHELGSTMETDVTISGLPLATANAPVTIAANDGGDGSVFYYLVGGKAPTDLGVYRKDGAYERRVSLPIDPAGQVARTAISARFTTDGKTLLVRTADDTLTAYSTRDEGLVSFGMRPTSFRLDEPRGNIVTAGVDGLRTIPLAGGDDTVLESAAIDTANLSFNVDNAYYTKSGSLWQVALDGKSVPVKVAPSAVRALALGPTLEVAYSTDPSSEYAGGAGDGWLAGVKFMERGRGLAFSGDGSRLRWLEHAATLGGYGDLTTRVMRSGIAETLATNVPSYAELADGKVLAIEDAVYAGSWNRLVVIDEAARTKSWVAQGVTNFVVTADRKTIILDAVSGASGYNVYRIDAP